MANDDQARLPSSQGGLIMYFDADTGFEMDPKTVVGLCLAISATMIALHARLFAAF